jgi:hypothetical protein
MTCVTSLKFPIPLAEVFHEETKVAKALCTYRFAGFSSKKSPARMAERMGSR